MSSVAMVVFLIELEEGWLEESEKVQRAIGAPQLAARDVISGIGTHVKVWDSCTETRDCSHGCIRYSLSQQAIATHNRIATKLNCARLWKAARVSQCTHAQKTNNHNFVSFIHSVPFPNPRTPPSAVTVQIINSVGCPNFSACFLVFMFHIQSVLPYRLQIEIRSPLSSANRPAFALTVAASAEAKSTWYVQAAPASRIVVNILSAFRSFGPLSGQLQSLNALIFDGLTLHFRRILNGLQRADRWRTRSL